MRAAAAALVFALAAGCWPAPRSRATITMREATTARASCPEVPPDLEDPAETGADAGALAGQKIERICVYGAGDEDAKSTITRALGIAIGDALDPAAARAGVLAILALQTIDDVAIGAEAHATAVVLHVSVTELPRVDELVVEGGGASVAPPRVEPGSPLDRHQLKTAVKLAEADYVGRGYGGAHVELEIEPTTPGHVRARIRVREGPQWRIGQLAFPGAARIGEKELRASADLPEGSVFSPEKVEAVGAKLPLLYAKRGMLTARVTDLRRDVAEDGAVALAWTIDEGEVYVVGKVRFAELGEKLQKELGRVAKLRSRTIFDQSIVDSDMERIRLWFARRGKSVTVAVWSTADPTKKTVEVIYRIEEKS